MHSLGRSSPKTVVDHSVAHDAFNARNLLCVDAKDLKTTCVSPHLESPIKEDANVLWCGTFQLAWNEVCSLVGEDLHFAGQEPEMVAILNKKGFPRKRPRRRELCGAGGLRAQRRPRPHRPRTASQVPWTGEPQVAAVARRHAASAGHRRLFVPLQELGVCRAVRKRIEEPLTFGKSRVSCFGIGDVYKPGQAAMYGQVQVLDYRNADDFIIELRTKSAGDRLVLASIKPGKHCVKL